MKASYFSMQCPWCSRQIGFPSPSRSLAQCPYCGGQYSYAFRGRTVLKYLLPAALVTWLLVPYLGGMAILLMVCLLLASSLYLEKWF